MTKLPDTTFGDPTHDPFWKAAERKELHMQYCGTCDSYQFYARPFCLACDSTDLAWRAVTGRGTVYSMSRVHLSSDSDRETPYIVALVDLEEGPRLLTNLIGDELAIGDPVAVQWLNRDDKPPLVVFGAVRDDS